MTAGCSSRFEWCVEVLEHRWLLALFGPDMSFGVGGHVVDVPAQEVIAPLAGGKILTVGYRSIPVPGIDSPSDLLMVVARVNDDGTLDTSFGNGGTVELDRTDINQSRDAEFTGSRLWVVAPPASPNGHAVELRAYTPELVLDTSFSDDGRLEMPVPIELQAVNGASIVAATADGGVIVDVQGVRFEDHALVKVNADGSLDPGFGTGGIIGRSVFNPHWTSGGLLQEQNGSTQLDRFFSGGFRLDPSFGVGGSLDLPGPLRGFAEQPDGKLLVVTRGDGSATRALHRYNANGTPDTTFGTGGSVTLPDVVNSFDRVPILFDDQQRIIVVTGQVRRFSPAGVPDPGPFEGDFALPNERVVLDATGERLLGSDRGDLVRYAAHDPIERGRDGVLYVTRDVADDVVTIGAGATPGTIAVSLNGAVTEVDGAGLVGINVALGEGDNSLIVTSDLPVTVEAGAGNDSITTGGGDDSITAGAGGNVLDVGHGNDTLRAGDFDRTDLQSITGGDGDKQITVVGSTSTITLGVGDSHIRHILGGGAVINIAGGSNEVELRHGGASTTPGSAGSITIGGSGDNTVSATSDDPSLTIITGDGKDDVTLGSPGTVRTNGGADLVRLQGNSGPLTVFLGDGHDRAVWIGSFNASDYTVFGGPGNDYIEGGNSTRFADEGVGDQLLFGEAGNDTLFGGVGADLLNGGGGDDQIIGGAGADRLYGWTGNDTLDAGPGDDRLLGYDGNDNLYGASGDDTIFGGAGHDRLYAERGDDELFGEGGNDRLYADYTDGVATLHGGNGDDLLVTDDGLVDHVFGDAGDDRAVADGDDELDGVESTTAAEEPPEPWPANVVLDSGLLTLTGTESSDAIAVRVSGAGRLTTTIDDATHTFDAGRVVRIAITGGGGNDVLGLDGSVAIPADIDAGPGDDRLVGGARNDTLRAGFGNDTLDGGLGDDSINGDGGIDTLDYSLRTRNLVVDLLPDEDDLSEAGRGGERGEGDRIRDIHRVIGGGGNDLLAGANVDETLIGGAGNDTLLGRAGNDKLEGGDGDDYFEGGGGDDHLTGDLGADRLFGLAGNDRILSTADGLADTVRGGDGDDSADADNVDDVIGVERVE